MPFLSGYTGYPQGLDLETIAKRGDLVGFVLYVFIFGLAISGLTALGVFLWSGLLWLTSAARPAQRNDAKDRMKNAVFGILLLLGSYILLITISPDLIGLGFGKEKLKAGGLVYCWERESDGMIFCEDTKEDCSARASGDNAQCGTGDVRPVWCNVVLGQVFPNPRDCLENYKVCLLTTLPSGEPGWAPITNFTNNLPIDCRPEEQAGWNTMLFGQFYVPKTLPKLSTPDNQPLTSGARLYDKDGWAGDAGILNILNVAQSSLNLNNENFNDKTQSIRIAPGYFAVLFENAGFGSNGFNSPPGNGIYLFESSTAASLARSYTECPNCTLAGETSSIIVAQSDSAATGKVTLYQDDNGGGRVVELPLFGSFSLGEDFNFNDAASSISIEGPLIALLYQDDNWGSRVVGILGPTSGTVNIPKTGWPAQDWVSSVLILGYE